MGKFRLPHPLYLASCAIYMEALNQNNQQTHNITSYRGWHGTSPHYQRYIMLLKVWLGILLNTVRPTPVGFISFLMCPCGVPEGN